MTTNWLSHLSPATAERLSEVWIPVGLPGFSGAEKARWNALLSERFGSDGWRISHIVRGKIVPRSEAILEYEEAYRRYLRARPELVVFLVEACGNVYDDNPTNVYDNDYEQPHTAMNHYQDISVRRVISELVDDPAWPSVRPTPEETVELLDFGTGEQIRAPRARGFRGNGLLQIRDPLSPGYMLNPAVVPAHDPALLTTNPGRREWYHDEGCGHLSIEAFWQSSKVVEVRLDRFIVSGGERSAPLAGL
ncbi:MAG: hypothetical protein ACO25N_00070 [Candidatus Limnocylindrus sp.]|nr:hypothetical protein [Candidatus Aquidulcis sp.]